MKSLSLKIMLLKPAIAAAVLVIAVSCSSAPSSSNGGSAADTAAATEIADSLANPQTGLIGDVNDQFGASSGGTINQANYTASFGTAGYGAAPLFFVTSSGRFPVYTNGVLVNFQSGSDSGGVYYYKDISEVPYTGSGFSFYVNYLDITNRFYLNPIGTPPSSGYSGPMDFLTNRILAVHHTRAMNTFFTNTVSGVARERTFGGDIWFTNIVADPSTSNCTAVLFGTRADTVFVTGPFRNGTFTVTNNLQNILLSRQMLSPGNYYTSMTGTMAISVIGIWTNSIGKVKTVNETDTITFDGSYNVTVTCGGVSVVVDMLTYSGATN
jgi:hypothetical protein